MNTRIIERTSIFRLDETAARTVIFEAASNILIREVAGQGPPGRRGPSGGKGDLGPPGPAGISTLEGATDYNPAARTGGSVIEYDQGGGTYVAGAPINTRTVHGGYF